VARLPFNYCNLTFKPALDPYCAIERISDSDAEKVSAPAIKFYGIVFDIVSIVPII